jgi:hypothetical protein
MAWGVFKGKKVLLGANYLYTRRTYVIDPEKSLKAGSLLKGSLASYINGGFPSGVAVVNGWVIESNRSPTSSIVYVASLSKVIAGEDLLEARKTSFAPPALDAMGPAILGDDLVMLTTDGRLYSLPIKSFLD